MFPIIPTESLQEDECYLADQPTSMSIEIDGRIIYLLTRGEPEAYVELKRAHIVTHRISVLEERRGLQRCEMVGTDGSIIKFYCSTEDVYHNMRIAEQVMSTEKCFAYAC
jgi:hypothetical protein